jgi:hypothetical protein
MIAPSATPTRTRSTTAPSSPDNHWERGVVKDERGLPISGSEGPLGVKELANDRRRIEKRLKEIKDPKYWASQSPSPHLSN